MKKIICLMVISCFVSSANAAFSFSDIPSGNWAGSGSNQTGIIIHWSAPEYFNLAYSWGGSTPMPAPSQDISMAWGYRYDGEANVKDMMFAIAQADPRLYLHIYNQPTPGLATLGIGYDLDGDGFGLSDGTTTYGSNDFTDGVLNAHSITDGDYYLSTDDDDLYWGGNYGATWELWQEQSGNGGFSAAPDRGSEDYWTPNDIYFSTGSHGEWDYIAANIGISSLSLEDGSWFGWSVAAGGLDMMLFDEGTMACQNNKQAPVLPVPEPATLGMIVLGGLNLFVRKDRKKHG